MSNSWESILQKKNMWCSLGELRPTMGLWARCPSSSGECLATCVFFVLPYGYIFNVARKLTYFITVNLQTIHGSKWAICSLIFHSYVTLFQREKCLFSLYWASRWSRHFVRWRIISDACCCICPKPTSNTSARRFEIWLPGQSPVWTGVIFLATNLQL